MKRRVIVLILISFLLLLATGCDPGAHETSFIHPLHARSIETVEIVQVEEVDFSKEIEYTVLHRITDIDEFAQSVLALSIKKSNDHPDLYTGIREHSKVFRILYFDGCCEFVDAAGKAVFPGEECAKYWGPDFQAGEFIYSEEEFDALIRKYLAISV